jgi:TPR repeat protein
MTLQKTARFGKAHKEARSNRDQKQMLIWSMVRLKRVGRFGKSTRQNRDNKMARFDMQVASNTAMGGENQADVFCEMGLAYATGRGRPVDLVAAHKWLNIAAIKGCDRAVDLRADLSMTMSKADLAAALRAAREWMTVH